MSSGNRGGQQFYGRQPRRSGVHSPSSARADDFEFEVPALAGILSSRNGLAVSLGDVRGSSGHDRPPRHAVPGSGSGSATLLDSGSSSTQHGHHASTVYQTPYNDVESVQAHSNSSTAYSSTVGGYAASQGQTSDYGHSQYQQPTSNDSWYTNGVPSNQDQFHQQFPNDVHMHGQPSATTRREAERFQWSPETLQHPPQENVDSDPRQDALFLHDTNSAGSQFSDYTYPSNGNGNWQAGATRCQYPSHCEHGYQPGSCTRPSCWYYGHH